MREIMLHLDAKLGRRASVEAALRDAIRGGQLGPGTLLPATRILAKDLGMARATVVAAYEQLVIEGYLSARPGAGTMVTHSAASDRTPRAPRPAPTKYEVDLRPGEPDPGSFPRSSWMRSMRRAINDSPEDAFRYGDPLGSLDLRMVLADYLGRTRGVVTDADSISVFAGIAPSFGFLGEMFIRRGVTRIAVEDPSLPILHQILTLVGIEIVPVPVDGQGINVDALNDLDVGAVIVSPAHQFPLGVTLSGGRRNDLVAWARNGERFIIEDDYDGHFRFDRHALGSIQGLEPDRVIYAGTLSKSLSPALRLSWLTVPHELSDDLASVKHLRGSPSWLDQLALADFIERGELDRQLRVTKSNYSKRRVALAQLLNDVAPRLEQSTVEAGLHLTATTDVSLNTAEIVVTAAKRSIDLSDLSSLWVGPPTRAGLVIGFSRPSNHEYNRALDRLGEVLESCDGLR